MTLPHRDTRKASAVGGAHHATGAQLKPLTSDNMQSNTVCHARAAQTGVWALQEGVLSRVHPSAPGCQPAASRVCPLQLL